MSAPAPTSRAGDGARKRRYHAANKAKAVSACEKLSSPYANSGVPNSSATTANEVVSVATSIRFAALTKNSASRMAGSDAAKRRIALSVTRIVPGDGGPANARAMA